VEGVPEMTSCPYCGFGEVVDFAGDEFYTPGCYAICDCGYSTMQPRISYTEFEAQVQVILGERRAILQQQADCEATLDKAQMVINRSIGQRVAKAQAQAGHPFVDISGGDGRNWKTIAPKSQQARTQARHEIEDIERLATKLWQRYGSLCQMFPAYAARFDGKARG
jgi:hypothetical protein